MTWSADSIIDTIFVPLYAVLLIANIFNCAKHGRAREAGYILLVVACIIKIAGSVLSVLYNTGAETNVTVDVWGQILIQLGLFPVLSASLAFIRKWLRNWETQDPRLTNYLRPMRLLQILIIGGLICSIIGGTDMSPGDANINTGYTLRRVGDFFFIIAVAAIFVSTTMLYSTSPTHAQRHDRQLTQIFFVLPISALRTVYSTVQAFLSTPENPGHNTWVYLVLLLIPDLVSVAIYTWFGLRLPGPGAKTVEMYAPSDVSASTQLGATKLADLSAIPKAYIQGGNMEAAQSAYGQPQNGYHYSRH